MANVCDVLVKILGEAGVRQIFGVPGDAINALTESIRQQDIIKFIHVNHEETGAFAASGQAKLTGRLGVCCGTAGPGAIHLLNGLYDAKCDHAPVLAITGQIESRYLGSNYQQEVDLHNLFSDVAVYNQVVTNPEQMPYMAVQAINAALEHRGVAHLNIPVDITTKHVPEPDKWQFKHQRKVMALESDAAMDSAAELLNKHEKIAILAGIGCYRAEDEVMELAEKLGAPVIHALRAKELFPESHPLSIGGLGMLGVKPSVEAISNCELLLMVGTDFPYFEFYPHGKKVIQIDIDPRQIGKRISVDIGLAGDAKAILDKLLPQVKRKEKRKFLENAQSHKQKWWAAMEKDINDKSSPVKPQRLAHLLGEKLGENAVVVSDTGLVTAWNARYLQVKKGQRYTVSGSLATMAFSLGAAIGAKLAYPEKQVVCVTGDGGFSMLMTDFLTAVKHKLNIVVIIFNNSKLGMITVEQEAKAGVPDYETDMFNLNFGEYAKLCGGGGIQVTEESQLQAALDQAFASSLPFVIDVMIDPQEVPLPPKIHVGQVMNFGIAKIKELVS